MSSRVFLDSSVVIAALLSDRGASHFILTDPVLQENYSFSVSEYVVTELLSVISRKLPLKVKDRLFLLLGVAGVGVLSNPSKNEVGDLISYVNQEDAPILASAMRHSNYLLTLDNDFLGKKTIEFCQNHGLTVMKPGEFLRHINPETA